MLAVVGIGGGLLYLFLEVGRIPIKLALIIVVLMFVTLVAIVKSLFVRGNDASPGCSSTLAGSLASAFSSSTTSRDGSNAAVDNEDRS